jgi:hypothetical protein
MPHRDISLNQAQARHALIRRSASVGRSARRAAGRGKIPRTLGSRPLSSWDLGENRCRQEYRYNRPFHCRCHPQR